MHLGLVAYCATFSAGIISLSFGVRIGINFLVYQALREVMSPQFLDVTSNLICMQTEQARIKMVFLVSPFFLIASLTNCYFILPLSIVGEPNVLTVRGKAFRNKSKENALTHCMLQPKKIKRKNGNFGFSTGAGRKRKRKKKKA